MLVKNFFGERIELPSEVLSEPEEIKAHLESHFGIPQKLQRIFMVKGCPILSMRSPERCSGGAEVLIPDEFKELGACQEDFNCFYSLCHDFKATKKHMFPFIFSREKQEYVFENVQKKGLESIDTYVGSMSQSQKNAIMGNLEAYINAFIN